MLIPDNIKNFLLNSESKALATYGKYGVNVVPVSVIKVRENKIVLLNFFMGKTVENLLENSEASLVCWKGLEGYQFKSNVEYLQEGKIFEEENEFSKKEFPERILKGVLLLEVESIFDVSLSNPGNKIL